MNIKQTKEVIRVMQAFVDGKEVLLKRTPNVTADDPYWNWGDDTEMYRIKSIAKLRPWTADEVPLGAWIKSKHDNSKSLILEVDKIGQIWVNSGPISREAALENHEHSTDKGVTWLPCGVMEEGK